MAEKARIELDRGAVRALLQSGEVVAELGRRASAIAAAAGPGMEAEVRVGATRARATVRTATIEAELAEAIDRALTRALDAGR